MKQVHANYTFVASTKTITLTGLNIAQDQLLLITNATRGIIYYNFASSSHRAVVTAGANTTVVLTDASTTGHADSDQLVIHYDDQASSSVVAANLHFYVNGEEGGYVPVSLGNGTEQPEHRLPVDPGKISSETFLTQIAVFNVDGDPTPDIDLGNYSEGSLFLLDGLVGGGTIVKFQWVGSNNSTQDIVLTRPFAGTTTTNVSAGDHVFVTRKPSGFRYLRIVIVSGGEAAEAYFNLKSHSDPYYGMPRPVSGTVTAGLFPQNGTAVQVDGGPNDLVGVRLGYNSGGTEFAIVSDQPNSGLPIQGAVTANGGDFAGVPNGSATPTKAVLIGGSNGGAFYPADVNSNGYLSVGLADQYFTIDTNVISGTVTAESSFSPFVIKVIASGPGLGPSNWGATPSYMDRVGKTKWMDARGNTIELVAEGYWLAKNENNTEIAVWDAETVNDPLPPTSGWTISNENYDSFSVSYENPQIVKTSDVMLLGSNGSKIDDGGTIPVVIAGLNADVMLLGSDGNRIDDGGTIPVVITGLNGGSLDTHLGSSSFGATSGDSAPSKTLSIGVINSNSSIINAVSDTSPMPVTASSLGKNDDSSASTDTGTFSLISLFKRLLSRVTTLIPDNLTVNATRLLVDGSGVTQPVSGTVTANTGLTQPLTDTQLRATAVPVSGTITASQATAANLNATVVQGTATNLKTQAESYQGGTAVGSANPLQVTLANTGVNTTALQVRPRNGAITVTSGSTSGTANTSSQALASSSSRQYLLIQNISDTDMYVNFGATATSDNLLISKNGGGVVFESGFVPTDSVNVICSAASKKYFILSA